MDVLRWCQLITTEDCILVRALSTPDDKLIKAFTTGTVQNTSDTTADVTRSTDIYGLSIEALKGDPKCRWSESCRLG
jgi:hypothetical protein